MRDLELVELAVRRAIQKIRDATISPPDAVLLPEGPFTILADELAKIYKDHRNAKAK